MDYDHPYAAAKNKISFSPKILWAAIALLAAGLSLLLFTGSTEKDVYQLKAELVRVNERLDSLSKAHQELKDLNEALVRRTSGLDFPALEKWRNSGVVSASTIVVQAADGSVPSVTLTPSEISLLGAPTSRTSLPTTLISAGAISLVRDKTSVYLGAVGSVVDGDTEMVVRLNSTGGAMDQTVELKAGGGDAWAKVGEMPRGTNAYSRSAMIQIAANTPAVSAWEASNSKSSLMVPGRLALMRAMRPLINIDLAERGGRFALFDEVGKEARISMHLAPENGEPGVMVEGATKFGFLYPNYDRPSK